MVTFLNGAVYLMLKKVKQDNKCYETQEVTFMIMLKSFNKGSQTPMYTKSF